MAPDAVDFIQLHHRPDPRAPEAQVTLRAELRDGRPVIVVTLPSRPAEGGGSSRADIRASSGRTMMAGTGLPPRAPDATCEGCGATGTVGRAIRGDSEGNAIEMHRFCVDCWPEWSARYRARWQEQDRRRQEAFLRRDLTQPSVPEPAGTGTGMTFEAATWHNTIEFVREIERSMRPPTPPAPVDLQAIAAEIESGASAIEGDMPFEVEAFIARYGARTS
ncbi:MAG: hypothetical protein H7066_16640 [Cytophagaceae bacterium]|nr:hypothetical protein [Gemmatimonadaceae bacterium]